MLNLTSADQQLSGGWGVHAAEQIQQSCLAGAGRSNHGYEFASLDLKGYSVQCSHHFATARVCLGQRGCSHDRCLRRAQVTHAETPFARIACTGGSCAARQAGSKAAMVPSTMAASKHTATIHSSHAINSPSGTNGRRVRSQLSTRRMTVKAPTTPTSAPAMQVCRASSQNIRKTSMREAANASIRALSRVRSGKE